jgi:hypothetical protein
MEQFIFLFSAIAIIGLALMFGFVFLKIENNYLNTDVYSDKNFDSFMKKIKGNSSRIKY